MTPADEFLLSGEFHYFRVPRAAWADRPASMRDAGLTAASIYIPWNWHQPAAGPADLTGTTSPERDLHGALTAIMCLRHATWGLLGIERAARAVTLTFASGGVRGEITLTSTAAEPALDGGRVSEQELRADGLRVLVIQPDGERVTVTIRTGPSQ